jgi:hypothetical protein
MPSTDRRGGSLDSLSIDTGEVREKRERKKRGGVTEEEPPLASATKRLLRENEDGAFELSSVNFIVEARTSVRGLKKVVEFTVREEREERREETGEEGDEEKPKDLQEATVESKKAFIELPTIALSDESIEMGIVEDTMRCIKLDRGGNIVFE